MKQTYLAATIFPALLAWSASFEAVQEKGIQALNQGHIKEAEALYGNFLKDVDGNERGYTKAHLAIVYFKDQEHEKAFQTYLEALEDSTPSLRKEISQEEQKLYDEALKIYLEDAGLNPGETAQKIRHQFEPSYEKNRNFYQLGYLIAVSQANLGLYDRFFDTFYHSYLADPQHFLAFKAKAALHIKLFERAKTETQREEQRQQIIHLGEQAAALEPKDTSLYRLILGFTPEENKAAMLRTYLNKIIDQNIVLSRIDIPYYVEIAIAFEEYVLAQKFLDKAKDWYAYSRVINVAQQRLGSAEDRKKG